MQFEDGFGLLRELLAQTPSFSRWEQLCHLLTEDLTETEQDAAMDYVEAHLASWDDNLRHAPLKAWWPSFPQGAPSPLWRLVRVCLVPANKLKPSQLKRLASSPHLQHITHLGLSSQQLDAHAIEAFFHHPGLTCLSLRALTLSNNSLDADAMKLLADVPFSQLQSLHLGRNALKNQGVNHLMKARFLPSLQTLHLDNCNIGDEGLTTIASCIELDQLQELNLNLNTIHSQGFFELIHSANLPALKRLFLMYNKVGETTAEIPFRFPYAPHDPLAQLPKTPLLSRLESLLLHSNPLSEQGKARLQTLQKQLRTLSIEI